MSMPEILENPEHSRRFSFRGGPPKSHKKSGVTGRLPEFFTAAALFAALFFGFGANTAFAVALSQAAGAGDISLTPHRAVYELTLVRRKSGVSISGVEGRMIYEITGSSCDGYTQNSRTVTRVTDEQGKESLLDSRSSTWEKGDGERFRFSSSNYLNQSLREMVAGSAVRDKKSSSVMVRLRRPGEAVLSLAGGVLFPTQHNLALLKSAQAGKHRLAVQVYDGSEQGLGYYQTYAYIGDRSAPELLAPHKGEAAKRELKKISKMGLGRLHSWPVAISYFNNEARGDSTPAYELSFRLYPNGVSRNLLINYGDYSVHGRLRKLTYLHKTGCR